MAETKLSWLMVNMLSEKYIFLLLASISFGSVRIHFVNTLPTAVELGGAIVAAVEEDQAQQFKRDNLKQQGSSKNDSIELNQGRDLKKHIQSTERMDEARGKYHKKNKMLKHLYPLFIGTVLAKTILVPLILKLLTAISTSSFIMAKIALAASGLLALKWALGNTGSKERTRFEVVHLPVKHSGYNSIDWDDLSWSGSSNIDVQTTPKQRLKYIPVKGSSSSNNGFQGTYSKSKVLGTTNDYSYNYDKDFNGRPFL